MLENDSLFASVDLSYLIAYNNDKSSKILLYNCSYLIPYNNRNNELIPCPYTIFST